jgi:hypothetical protein
VEDIFMKFLKLLFVVLTLISFNALAETSLKDCGKSATKFCKLTASASEKEILACVEKHERQIKKTDKTCFDAHEDYEKAHGGNDND